MTAQELDERKSNQYLTFTLRDEDFAIDIAKIREVLDVATITKIPRMPSFVCGVINLRGNVVPVLDLGYRLGMKPVEHGVSTCVMIVEVVVNGAITAMGALADSVQMVLDIPATDIEAVPRMGTNINTDFIAGMGRHNDKLLIILNIDKVLDQEGEELASCLDMSLELAQAEADKTSAENAAATC